MMLSSGAGVMPESIDVNALVEERVSFLRSSHPDIVYQLKLAAEKPQATADPDLIKGALTNLLENAADAARQPVLTVPCPRPAQPARCV